MADPFPNMRGLTLSAFVLDGAAAVGFIAVMAFGDGCMTPLDGFVLSALLLGFFSALGSILMTTPPRRFAAHAKASERRNIERRVADRGSPAGVERRSGVDRRLSDLSLEAFMSPRSGFEHEPVPIQ